MQGLRHAPVSQSGHLHRYVAESVWRFDLRQIGEGARVNAIMFDGNGHLRYKALIS